MEIVYIDKSIVKNYNNNNFHHLAPFRFVTSRSSNDTIILDSLFYNKIKQSWFEDELKSKFIIQHEDNILFESTPNNDHEEFWFVYNTMINWYDAQFWAHCNDSKIITLSPLELFELKQLCIVYDQMNIMLLQNLSAEFRARLASYVTDNPIDGYFVKLGLSSTKHDFAPYPVHTIDGILAQIIESQKLRNIIYSTSTLPCTIILTPWDTDITMGNEFRVFVEDGKVVGMSQQSLYDVHPMAKYCIQNTDEILSRVQMLWDNIYCQLGNKFKYIDAVLDIYITTESLVPKLIEINPIGVWGPAGSGLFCWCTDPPMASRKQIRIVQ